jgi:hypothetical protein
MLSENNRDKITKTMDVMDLGLSKYYFMRKGDQDYITEIFMELLFEVYRMQEEMLKISIVSNEKLNNQIEIFNDYIVRHITNNSFGERTGVILKLRSNYDQHDSE